MHAAIIVEIPRPSSQHIVSINIILTYMHHLQYKSWSIRIGINLACFIELTISLVLFFFCHLQFGLICKVTGNKWFVARMMVIAVFSWFVKSCFFAFPVLVWFGWNILGVHDTLKYVMRSSKMSLNFNKIKSLVFKCNISLIFIAIFWWKPHQTWTCGSWDIAILMLLKTIKY